MAIEDINDKQIKDLLENHYVLNAIKIDFNDLNNLNLIIRNSFKEGHKRIMNSKDRDNYYFIGKVFTDHITILGLIQMYDKENILYIDWLETSLVFKHEGVSKTIIAYLEAYAKFRHFKKIIVHCEKTDDFKIFKNYNKQEGTLNLEKEIS